MPNQHATLSPSAAGRWMSCTPSVRLEEKIPAPEVVSEAAEEGTVAHELGETILRLYSGEIKKSEYNKIIKRIKEDKYYNSDMQEHADSYAAFVIEHYEAARKITKDAVLCIETRLDLTEYIEEGFGTGDAIVIADGVLDIIDLKYGKGVPVSCVNNKQMMIYALGALREFDVLYDIHTVRMSIYQPRLNNISSFEMSVQELQEWARTELKPKAELAYKGDGEFVSGDHCRFCRAKVLCRAHAEKQLELAKYDFKDPDMLEDSDISDILTRADNFKNWIGAVEAYALTQAVDHGKSWEGFKLVEGRSVRTYTNQDAVAERLTSNGIEECIIYTKSLLGITAMEKAITKKRFAELLSDLVIKPQGKPTLVPVSDKRPEWSGVESAKNDFSDN